MRTARSTKEDSNRPRILVVDDQPTFADLLALILELSGFSVRAVYSGHAAVDLSRTFVPDVVLTDIQMPAMDGVSTAIAIKRQHPDCGVILLSGSDPEQAADSVAMAKTQGWAFDFISKPLLPGDIIARISDMLRKRGSALDADHCGRDRRRNNAA